MEITFTQKITAQASNEKTCTRYSVFDYTKTVCERVRNTSKCWWYIFHPSACQKNVKCAIIQGNKL